MRRATRAGDDDSTAATRASASLADAGDKPPASLSDDAAKSAPRGPEVWDESKMSELVAMMGPKWVEARLGEFAAHLERRLDSLASLPPSELARSVHALMGMAGFLGFGELLAHCARVEGQARLNIRADGLEDLRAAGERVASAIRWRPYRAPSGDARQGPLTE